MKITLSIFFIFFACCSIAQQVTTVIYDGNGYVIGGSHIRLKAGEQVILKDSSSARTFILDTSHIFIVALNSQRDTVWKTDPWKDNKLEVYRTKRPRVVDMTIGSNEGWISSDKKPENVLWIRYNNTQFGFISLTTGKFHFSGQD
jgi:hypothetical protein